MIEYWNLKWGKNMIRKNGNYNKEVKVNMRGGEGSVTIEKFWEPGEELKSKNRLFAKLTLMPGSSIGFHKHENEEEVFVVLQGTAEADDNGEKVFLEKGDTILTGEGKGHSIKSVGKDNLQLLAVISCY